MVIIGDNLAVIKEKPQPPASNECCGSGSCCPCVWDDYREKLKLWQQANGITATAPEKTPNKDEKGRVWPTFR